MGNGAIFELPDAPNGLWKAGLVPLPIVVACPTEEPKVLLPELPFNCVNGELEPKLLLLACILPNGEPFVGFCTLPNGVKFALLVPLLLLLLLLLKLPNADCPVVNPVVLLALFTPPEGFFEFCKLLKGELPKALELNGVPLLLLLLLVVVVVLLLERFANGDDPKAELVVVVFTFLLAFPKLPNGELPKAEFVLLLLLLLFVPNALPKDDDPNGEFVVLLLLLLLPALPKLLVPNAGVPNTELVLIPLPIPILLVLLLLVLLVPKEVCPNAPLVPAGFPKAGLPNTDPVNPLPALPPKGVLLLLLLLLAVFVPKLLPKPGVPNPVLPNAGFPKTLLPALIPPVLLTLLEPNPELPNAGCPNTLCDVFVPIPPKPALKALEDVCDVNGLAPNAEPKEEVLVLLLLLLLVFMEG